MPTKHARREGASKEKGKEKEEKGSTTRTGVSNWYLTMHYKMCYLFLTFSVLFSEEEPESEEEGEDPALDSLSQAIAFQVSVLCVSLIALYWKTIGTV